MFWVGKDTEDHLDPRHRQGQLPLDQVVPSHKIYKIYILYTCMDREKYRHACIKIYIHTYRQELNKSI